MSNPTDTNQASELFELCKEVYERTKWEAGDWYYERTDPKSTVSLKTLGRPDIGFHIDEYDQLCPLYTSDYLLEKLPAKVNGYDWLGIEKHTIDYYAVSYGTSGGGYAPDDYKEWYSADTPLKALLKLTIALSEAGELDNE